MFSQLKLNTVRTVVLNLLKRFIKPVENPDMYDSCSARSQDISKLYDEVVFMISFLHNRFLHNC